MTVIKINAITVPENSGDELARRFGARAGAVDDQDGFEGFELLRPTDERTTWLVITRWRDEAAFDAWVTSPAFAHGHRSASGSAEDAEGGAAESPQRWPGRHPQRALVIRDRGRISGPGRVSTPLRDPRRSPSAAAGVRRRCPAWGRVVALPMTVKMP
jgi:heme oxygenase (mycobilin-producing)